MSGIKDLLSESEQGSRSEDKMLASDPKGLTDGDTTVDSDIPSEHSLQCKLTNIEYIEEGNRPVVKLFGRDVDGNQWIVNVRGHRPSCYVPSEEVGDNFENHYAVDETEDGYESISGKSLTRVYTYLPKHVSEIRDLFTETYEADVFYYNRFLIDSGIEDAFEVDMRKAESGSHCDIAVDYEHVYPCETPTVDSRLGIIDIEVASEDGFPDVETADAPVSTIVAYDSYSGDYTGWILASDNWSVTEWHGVGRAAQYHTGTDIDDLRLFSDESAMLTDFSYYLSDTSFDLLSGWYCSDFDYPYLINRCRELGVYAYQEWSPMDNVYVSSRWNDPVVDGVTMFDMLEGYQKTQIHKLKSKTLEYVAQKECGYGKEDFKQEVPDDASNEYTYAWKHNPVDFLQYNHRDVEAVVEIEDSQSIIEMFDHIRSVAGATYDDCAANINLIDVLTLRHAKEAGICLPTSVNPDEDWYYGGWVPTPIAGLHNHVVYPDLASLYPNIMAQCNMSPETIIGTKEDLAESQYTEDDCVWSYIDTRPVEHKKDTDPVYEKCYFLDPSVKEGFVASLVDELLDMKDEYRGTAKYEAVKRVVNSVYGVYGDSKSFGNGFRLFDWRIAEAITLGGRKVIQYTAETFTEQCSDESYLVGGDSVPANEPTLIRRNGDVKIVSVKDVENEDAVWTEDGWSNVKKVIKKPNRKQLYTVWTKHGITHVTEDHGLIRDSGEEITPIDVNEGEALLHEDIADIDVSGMSMEEERAWLLGLFAAEGSCGIYECESGSKASWAINNQDRELLEHAQKILFETFGIETKIDNVMQSSNTMKLRLDKTGDNASIVLGFREMLYDGTEKRVPKEILNANERVQRAFVAGHHDGDGHIAHDHKEFDELWTKHKHLAAGLAFLLRQLGHKISMHVRTEQSDEFYRIRSVAFTVGNDDEIIGIEKYEYEGDYVYDLETENHHFQSGVGSMIVHNTDSAMTAIPDASTSDEAIDIAEQAAETVNQSYDQWVSEVFNAESRMDVELESYSSRCFFIGQNDGKSDEAVKKRYVTEITWEDGTYLDEPEFNIKGFEAIRSDVADVTIEAQKYVFRQLMDTEQTLGVAQENCYERITELVNECHEDDFDLNRLGIPVGIGQSLEAYGSPNRTPQPQYRGAKYANQFIYDGNAIGEGDKPLLFYVDRVGEGYRSTYDADTAENGRKVDAISVLDASDIPETISVDRETMVEKTIVDPLEPIFGTMDWSIDEVLLDSTQFDLSEFM